MVNTSFKRVKKRCILKKKKILNQLTTNFFQNYLFNMFKAGIFVSDSEDDELIVFGY